MDTRSIAAPQLDEQQRLVRDLPADASGVVIGAAGTGKSSTIVARVARLLGEEAVSPDEILVLTPIRHTATALRDRLDRDLDIATSGPLARSVASLAFQIVRAASAARSAPAPQLLSAADQDQIIADLLEGDAQDAAAGADRWPESIGAAVRSSRSFRAELRALVAGCAELDLGPRELAELARVRRLPAWESAASFLAEYRYAVARMRPHHRDPAQLVQEAAASIAGGMVTAVPRVLLVDDAQELTAGGIALLAAARSRESAVLVFGDPDIGSGSFRGAGPETFSSLVDMFGQPWVLREPHRQRPALTRLARTLTSAIGAAGVVSHRVAPGELSDADERDDPGEVRALIEASPFEELDSIAHALRSWHLLEGVGWNEMAVIAHDTGQVARLEVELAAREVPTRAPTTARPLRAEPAVRSLLSVIELGMLSPHSWDAAAVSAALTCPYGGLDAVGLRRLRARLRTHEFMDDGARSADELLVAAMSEPALLTLIGTPEARTAQNLALTLAEVDRLHARGASVHELLWTVWDRSRRERGWVDRSQGSGPDAAEATRALDGVVALFAAAKRAAEREDVSVEGFVREVLDSEVPDDVLAASPVREAVRILTPAAALGKEFAAVVIAGVQEGIWPNTRLRGGLLEGWRLSTDVAAWREGREPTELAVLDRRRGVLHEELRLFARALTRARDRVLVTAVSDEDNTPSVLFSFLPDPAPTSRDRYPLTLRGAVAAHRRVLTTSWDEPARAASAQALAVLAKAGVPGAHPDTWYGILPRSGGPAVHDPAVAPVSLSPSRIEAFEECSLDWVVRELGGDARSFSAGVGTILHAAMETAPDGSFEQIDEVVNQRWGELHFEAPWLSRQERQWARTLSRRLAAYLRDVAAAGGVVVGAESRFRIDIHDPKLEGDQPRPLAVISGSIDRVERYEGGDGPPRVVVVDLKTGRSESRVSDSKVVDDAQLAAYQLAVAAGAVEGVDEDAELAGAQLLVLSKTLKNAPYRIARQHPMTAQQRSAFVDRIVADARAMTADSFTAYPDTHCNDDVFAVCRLHTVRPVSAS